MDTVQSRTQGSNPEETSIKFQAFMVWRISPKILQPCTSDIRATSEETFEKKWHKIKLTLNARDVLLN